MRICERAPNLTDPAALAAVAEDLEEFPNTVCGTIDPLYVAASGAKGFDLYAMSEALSGIQKTCQDADCALVVTTHWNKNGQRFWR